MISVLYSYGAAPSYSPIQTQYFKYIDFPSRFLEYSSRDIKAKSAA
jgi:hypothetical protein